MRSELINTENTEHAEKASKFYCQIQLMFSLVSVFSVSSVFHHPNRITKGGAS